MRIVHILMLFTSVTLAFATVPARAVPANQDSINKIKRGFMERCMPNLSPSLVASAGRPAAEAYCNCASTGFEEVLRRDQYTRADLGSTEDLRLYSEQSALVIDKCMAVLMEKGMAQKAKDQCAEYFSTSSVQPLSIESRHDVCECAASTMGETFKNDFLERKLPKNENKPQPDRYAQTSDAIKACIARTANTDK